MNQYEQDRCMGGDLIYGNSHGVWTALTRPLRCQTGLWVWPEPMPEPPVSLLADMDSGLRSAYERMRREREARG